MTRVVKYGIPYLNWSLTNSGKSWVLVVLLLAIDGCKGANSYCHVVDWSCCWKYLRIKAGRVRRKSKGQNRVESERDCAN